MSRIAARFERLKKEGRKALIPFFTAGDPDRASCVPLMHALVAGGADVIELGVPFSDPMADGPVIQRSSERALMHGVSLHDVINWVAEFRKTDTETPVVLMGYANPIESMGLEVLPRLPRRLVSTALWSSITRRKRPKRWCPRWIVPDLRPYFCCRRRLRIHGSSRWRNWGAAICITCH